ncbi:MAG: VCBS repeat-containing protein [Phaeodactylibacter sp.]|nr:VCBS repeat-containing protein [Phaeodactylibacter sp.]
MKKTALPTLFLLLAHLSFGQFGAEQRINFGITWANDVRPADLDSDGDLDVLLAGQNLLVWYENLDGNGSFGGKRIIREEGADFRAAFPADLDGDGDLDVISSRGQDQAVVWYENLGQGQFGGQQSVIAVLIDPYGIHAADLDGDGDVDVLATASGSGTDGKVFWFPNLGNGVFGSQQTLATAASSRAVTSADLDGDGLPDVLYGAFFGVLRWTKNMGNGAFAVQPALSTSIGSWAGNAIHTADLDGDGDVDVAAASRVNNAIVWFENTGGGSFGPASTVSTEAAGPRAVASGDLNGDGLPDLLSASSDDNKVAWYQNMGNGSFGPQQLLYNTTGGPHSVAAANFDNDGVADVLAGMRNSDKSVWLKNEGNGSFGPPRLVSREDLFLLQTFAADLDGDDDPDIVAVSRDINRISWYENLGGGNFGLMHVLTDEAEEPSSAFAADLDGDGDLDLLSSSKGDDEIAWYENDGAANFGSQRVLSASRLNPPLVIAADLDGDGLRDVLFPDAGNGTTYWCRNLGGGNFAPEQNRWFNFGNVQAYLPVDLDGDGDLDILGSSSGNDGLAWFENDGQASFTKRLISLEPDAAFGIVAADLDGDGDSDVACASRDDDAVSWFANDGNGNFGPRMLLPGGLNFPRALAAGDLDLDGDQDLVVGAYESDEVVWFENQGGGAFSAPTLLGVADGVSSLTAADLNRDGGLDLLAGSTFDNKISWYENFAGLGDAFVAAGSIFRDANGNGLRDPGEEPVTAIPLSLEPAALASYTNPEGQFRFFLSPGGYTLAPELGDCWELTTGPTSYPIVIDGQNAPGPFHFGVQLVEDGPAVLRPTLLSNPTRCGFNANFWLNLHNEGCTVENGAVKLALSPLVSLLLANPAPVEVAGDTLVWHFDNLYPGEYRQVFLQFEVAGAEFLGEFIRMPVLAFVEESPGNLALNDTFIFSSEIRCAYDPNDKLALPQRSQEPLYDVNYTLFGEELLYTVRFQNTGNDTAFNVVVRDYLSPSLDWHTLRPLSSSHPFEATLNRDNGLLELQFRNILLPDSTTNEPASHGYVNFAIYAGEGLAENTTVPNTARIYFDFNPPISTNTTENVLVSALPQAPAANFTYFNAPPSLQVDFEDLSANAPTSWLWTFGDGNGSTQQHPTHTYADPGSYVVGLRVSNALGADSVFSLLFLEAPPRADFFFVIDSLTVQFLDNSIFDPTDWYWDFGDGNTSTFRDPTHTYTAPGLYLVCLTVTNAAGSDTVCQEVELIVNGAREQERLLSFTILPQPAGSQALLRFGQPLPPGARLMLFSPLGRRVSIPCQTGGREMHLDTSALPAGVYGFEVSAGRNILARGRLVKR